MRQISGFTRIGITLLFVALVAAGCSGDGEASLSSGDSAESIMVQPDFSQSPLTINVSLTDEGFEPSTIFMPAGRPIRLVLRAGGNGEHHYRVEGLIPGNLQWIQFPEIDAYDIDSMSPAELAQNGIDVEGVRGDAELEHILHHLSPTFSPVKEASPEGVKPLGTEVHGYVTRGHVDVLHFYPLNTGRFKVEDVLNPEITGEVVVFAVDAAG